MSSAQGSSTKSMGSDQSSIRKFFFSNEFGLLFLIVVFATIFALLTTGFTSRFNLYALGRNISIDVVIGFSMMVVIVTGGLNLSVGSIGVSAVMFGGWLLEGIGSSQEFHRCGCARGWQSINLGLSNEVLERSILPGGATADAWHC